MTVFKRADSSNWMIEFRYLGEHVRQSSATSSKAKAKELEAQWRREIHDRKAVGKLPPITLGVAIDRYFDTVLVPKGKPKTRKKDLYYLNGIRSHFGPDTPLDKITAADIAAFRDGLVMVRQTKKVGIAASKINPIAHPPTVAVEQVPGHNLEIVPGGVGKGSSAIAVAQRPDAGHIGVWAFLAGNCKREISRDEDA